MYNVLLKHMYVPISSHLGQIQIEQKVHDTLGSTETA